MAYSGDKKKDPLDIISLYPLKAQPFLALANEHSSERRDDGTPPIMHSAFMVDRSEKTLDKDQAKRYPHIVTGLYAVDALHDTDEGQKKSGGAQGIWKPELKQRLSLGYNYQGIIQPTIEAIDRFGPSFGSLYIVLTPARRSLVDFLDANGKAQDIGHNAMTTRTYRSPTKSLQLLLKSHAYRDNLPDLYKRMLRNEYAFLLVPRILRLQQEETLDNLTDRIRDYWVQIKDRAKN
jgi:hypothetical protein